MAKAKLNPVTQIIDTTEQKLENNIIKKEEPKEPSKSIPTPIKPLNLPSIKKTNIGRFFSPSSRGKISTENKLKLVRMRNKIERAKLLNTLENLRLKKKIEAIKNQSQMQFAQQVISQPIKSKPVLYPAFSTPMEQADIDSGFNADSGYADSSLWGNEEYFNETYYDEKFYLDEFTDDPLMQLGIKVRTGVSPLFW